MSIVENLIEYEKIEETRQNNLQEIIYKVEGHALMHNKAMMDQLKVRIFSYDKCKDGACKTKECDYCARLKLRQEEDRGEEIPDSERSDYALHDKYIENNSKYERFFEKTLINKFARDCNKKEYAINDLYGDLISYNTKRIKLFERIKKINIDTEDWKRFVDNLFRIELEIAEVIKLDYYFLFMKEMKTSIKMVLKAINSKLKHCLSCVAPEIKSNNDAGSTNKDLYDRSGNKSSNNNEPQKVQEGYLQVKNAMFEFYEEAYVEKEKERREYDNYYISKTSKNEFVIMNIMRDITDFIVHARETKNGSLIINEQDSGQLMKIASLASRKYSYIDRASLLVL